MTRYSSSFEPQARLIEAKHRECLALQANFGAQELHRIQQEVYKTLEAEDAVS